MNTAPDTNSLPDGPAPTRNRALHALAVAVVVFAAVFSFARCGTRVIHTGARYVDTRIAEPSGLAASRINTGVFWTHNDSGDAATLYAVTADGQVLARYLVERAGAIDWEAITVGDDGYLYVGDIGNNVNDRRDLVVYRVAEPTVEPVAPGGGPRDGTLSVDRAIPFHYPEQDAFPPTARNFDAEALFWARHPDTGQGTLYLLTKHRGDQATVLYRFETLDGDERRPLTRRGTFVVGGDPERFGGMVTAADATPDGRLLAVLTYHALFVFERPASGDDYLSELRNRIDFDQDVTIQSEAIAWDGDTIIFTNEQGSIFRVDEPLEAREGRFPR